MQLAGPKPDVNQEPPWQKWCGRPFLVVEPHCGQVDCQLDLFLDCEPGDRFRTDAKVETIDGGLSLHDCRSLFNSDRKWQSYGLRYAFQRELAGHDVFSVAIRLCATGGEFSGREAARIEKIGGLEYLICIGSAGRG